MFAHMEPPRFYGLQAIPMVAEKPVTVVAVKEIKEAVERAARHLGRVLQCDGAGGEVTRIGISHLAILDTLVVEPLECRPVHENFAAYFEYARVSVGTQLIRDFLDGA